jgi:hypothetical protein
MGDDCVDGGEEVDGDDDIGDGDIQMIVEDMTLCWWNIDGLYSCLFALFESLNLATDKQRDDIVLASLNEEKRSNETKMRKMTIIAVS